MGIRAKHRWRALFGGFEEERLGPCLRLGPERDLNEADCQLEQRHDMYHSARSAVLFWQQLAWEGWKELLDTAHFEILAAKFPQLLQDTGSCLQ